MTAVDALVSRVAEVLGEHSHSYDLDCDEDFGCSCGVEYRQGGYGDVEHSAHAAHLAAVLADLIQSERAAAAVEALESAAERIDGLAFEKPNPGNHTATWNDALKAAAMVVNPVDRAATDTTPTKENDHG